MKQMSEEKHRLAAEGRGRQVFGWHLLKRDTLAAAGGAPLAVEVRLQTRH